MTSSGSSVPRRFWCMSSTYWSVWMALQLAGWIARPAVAADAGSPAQPPYSYRYFKETKPLRLDVSRVAFLRTPAEDGSVAAAPSLAAYGIDEGAVQPMVIRGWSFAGTAAAVKTDAAIERTVREIATQQAVDFVSPVFLDDLGGPMVITPHILVGFDRSIDPARAEAILAESGAGAILDRDWANMKRAYRLRSASRDGFEVLKAANDLAERPEVMFAEPDMILTSRAALIPNDPYFPDNWGLHNTGQYGGTPDADMDCPEAWDTTTGDPDIIVVILDQGVQQDHPDINQIAGMDFTSDAPGTGGGPVNACDNHGTPVAGCVSAIINNNIGVVGVAPAVKSASARISIAVPPCGLVGFFQTPWIVNALVWAESIGARVTNSSYALDAEFAAITQKYADTRAAGIVHFGPTGNEGLSVIVYPARLPSINAIAALDPTGNRASYSNYGPGLDFSAPSQPLISTDRTGSDGFNSDGGGHCINNLSISCNSDPDCSAVGGFCLAGYPDLDYTNFGGTSAASPYAAGVAALALSVNPALTACQVEEVLRQSSVDLGPAGYDTDYGWGFVNAANAVQLAANPPPSCHVAATPAADPGATKPRYLSFSSAPPQRQQAIRVTLTASTTFPAAVGSSWWVGPPQLVCENSGQSTPPGGGCGPAPGLASRTMHWSALQCMPECREWTRDNMGNLVDLIHIGDPNVAPQSVYEIQAVDCVCCDLGDEASFSAPLSISTPRWGDVAATGGACPRPSPDGVMGIADVTAELDKFSNAFCAVLKSRADLAPASPDRKIDVADITAVLNKFGLAPYSYPQPVRCP